MKVDCLPSIVISKIFSYLEWREKLLLLEAIPEWSCHLRTTGAWSKIVYQNSNQSNAVLRQCLSEYGRYVKSIELDFKNIIDIVQPIRFLYNCIANYCKNLKQLVIKDDAQLEYHKEIFLNLLSYCPLEDVRLIRPGLMWISQKQNTLSSLFISGHADKIQELHISTSSFGKVLLEDEEFDLPQGSIDVLVEFTNLQTLATERQFLKSETLIRLASCHLRKLKLCQYEELEQTEAMMYTSEDWNQVLSQKPDFQLSVSLENIILLKSKLVVNAPVTELILTNVVTSLTKGMLDTLTEYYHNSLQIFACTSSQNSGSIDITNEYYNDPKHLQDKRLPMGLINMVQCCKKLKSIYFGASIPSSVVLVIANIRKFNHFVLLRDEVTYKFDIELQPSWRPSYVEWLQTSSSNSKALEMAISKLFGCPWQLCDIQKYWDILHKLTGNSGCDIRFF